MQLVADYEEGLRWMNVDKTPLSQPLHPLHPLHWTYALLDIIEASVVWNGDKDNVSSNMLESQRQWCDNNVAPKPMEVDFVKWGGNDGCDSVQFVEESEATNLNNEDYFEEDMDGDNKELLYLAID